MKPISTENVATVVGGTANRAALLGVVVSGGPAVPIEPKRPQVWPGDDPLESI